MIKKISKPTTKRAKRLLEKKEPKVIEDPKHCLLLKGKHASDMVQSVLRDLHSFKKPYSTLLQRKNDINLFEDTSSLEFLCDKNDDASTFILGNHMKKRPNTVTFGRLYDGRVLDFVELSVQQYVGLDSFEAGGCALGQKRAMIFMGDGWDSSSTETGQQDAGLVKNILFDIFNIQSLEKIALNGIDSVIAVTHENGLFDFRVFSIQLKKSSSSVPFVSLTDIGPYMQFRISRVKHHDSDTWHHATRVPAILSEKKIKNVKKDLLGSTVGTLHVDQQDLSKLQTRKMKGLKRRRDEKDDQEEEQDNQDSDTNYSEEQEQQQEE